MGDRRASSKCQPTAPKLPGTFADPTRFGVEHDFYQTLLTDRLLKQQNVIVRSKIHRLGEDPFFGVRPTVHRLPPQVFSRKSRDHIRIEIVCRHTPQ